jgi:phage-related protein
MAEFNWKPSIGFSSDTNPRVFAAKFGDGYSQRRPAGINNLDQSWNLPFQNIAINTANDIETFFRSKNGSVSFTWIPPGETSEVRVVCTKWSKIYETSISRTINATFERVYE